MESHQGPKKFTFFFEQRTGKLIEMIVGFEYIGGNSKSTKYPSFMYKDLPSMQQVYVWLKKNLCKKK